MRWVEFESVQQIAHVQRQGCFAFAIGNADFQLQFDMFLFTAEGKLDLSAETAFPQQLQDENSHSVASSVVSYRFFLLSPRSMVFSTRLLQGV